MLSDSIADARNVLVELTVVPLGANGQVSEQIAKVVDIVETAGISHQQMHNGTCIEGRWSDISALIYACYERVQEQFPLGFLKVSIR